MQLERAERGPTPPDPTTTPAGHGGSTHGSLRLGRRHQNHRAAPNLEGAAPDSFTATNLQLTRERSTHRPCFYSFPFGNTRRRAAPEGAVTSRTPTGSRSHCGESAPRLHPSCSSAKGTWKEQSEKLLTLGGCRAQAFITACSPALVTSHFTRICAACNNNRAGTLTRAVWDRNKFGSEMRGICSL